MAKFSKKTVYVILLSLVILSLVLRYPLLDHERHQTDSYFIHGLASDISAHGRARWTVHPLSYIGYYPLSYPSGVPFLLSELGIATGLSMEAAVLLTGMAMGVLLCVSSFCFLRIFISRTEYSLLGVLLLVASARFVDATYWDATARGPLTVLILLTVLVMIEADRRADYRLTLTGTLMVVACVAVHHMAVFLILFVLAQITVAIGYARFVRRGPLGRPSLTLYYAGIASALIMVAFGVMTYLGSWAVISLGSTELFDFEPRFLSVMLNSMAVYSSQIGLIVPLAFLGIPYLFLRRQADPRNMYPLAVVMFFIPFVGFQLYVSLIVAPYLVVLGVNWIRSIDRAKLAALTITVLLIASSLALPFVMIDRWNDKTYIGGNGVIVDSDIFNAANYCRESYGSEVSITNSAGYAGLISSVSGVPFLGPGISSLLTGEVTSEDMGTGVEPSEVGFPQSLYSWFVYREDPLLVYFEARLMTLGIEYLFSETYSIQSGFHDFLYNHSRLVVYVDNEWPDSYVTVYSDRSAIFPSELRDSESGFEHVVEPGSADFAAYIVYETGRSSVYVVQLPLPQD